MVRTLASSESSPDFPPRSAALTTAFCIVMTMTPNARVSIKSQCKLSHSQFRIVTKLTFLDIVPDKKLTQIHSQALGRD